MGTHVRIKDFKIKKNKKLRKKIKKNKKQRINLRTKVHVVKAMDSHMDVRVGP